MSFAITRPNAQRLSKSEWMSCAFRSVELAFVEGKDFRSGLEFWVVENTIPVFASLENV